MSLVAGPNATYAGATFPSTIRPGEQVVAVVRFNNTGGGYLESQRNESSTAGHGEPTRP